MRPIDKLKTDHSHATVSWFDNPDGKPFLEMLHSWLVEDQKNLEKAEATVDIHRLQGTIAVLKRIIFFKDEVRQYQRDLMDGKIRPVSQKEGTKHGVV